MKALRLLVISLTIIHIRYPPTCHASLPDATDDVFGGDNKDIYPVAFGDYDSDKLTDVVVLKKDFSSFDIFFGASSPPLLSRRNGFHCDLKFQNKDGKEIPVQITGLQLADFTADGVTDICVSFVLKGEELGPTYVTIFKGNIGGLNCQKSVLKLSKSSPYLQMKQEPQVVDINGDFIADLVGEDAKSGDRKFWTFYKDGDSNPYPEEIDFPCDPPPCLPFAKPSANGFVDVDGDFAADLIIISENKTEKNSVFYIETFSVEETYGRPRVRFEKKLELATDTAISRIGSPVFMDINLKGELAQIIPYCSNLKCHNSGFLIVENDKVSRLDVKFMDNEGHEWGFLIPQMNTLYSGTISVRVGDFNLDGYPDLVGTLMMGRKSLSETMTRPVIFRNVPCDHKYCTHPRTFQPDFDLLQKHNKSINSAFFDVHEDGLLDIMVIRGISGSGSKETHGVFLDRNKPEYDAYFIKWILTTGLCETNCPPYGVRAPGASMMYNTTDLNSNLQYSRASQAYRTQFALDMPYTVMGCGQSSNFIDSVTFGFSKTKRNTRSQIIPNSILIVIPPTNGNYKWQIKHLLTPSVDGAVSTFRVLLLICFVNGSVVLYFWMKERKEDRADRRNRPLTMSGLTFA